MKKAIYFSAAGLLFMLPSISNARSPKNLSPTEMFCSNASARSGNAIAEIDKIVRARSRKLSEEDKQSLAKFATILDSSSTVEDICFPSEV